MEWFDGLDREQIKAVIEFAVRGLAPNVLYRQGWKPDSLKAGDEVTVVGSRAKNGSNLVNRLPSLWPMAAVYLPVRPAWTASRPWSNYRQPWRRGGPGAVPPRN